MSKKRESETIMKVLLVEGCGRVRRERERERERAVHGEVRGYPIQTHAEGGGESSARGNSLQTHARERRAAGHVPRSNKNGRPPVAEEELGAIRFRRMQRGGGESSSRGNLLQTQAGEV